MIVSFAVRPLYCPRFPLWDGAGVAMAASERLQRNVFFFSTSKRAPLPPPNGSLQCVHQCEEGGPLPQKPESTVNGGNGPEKRLESPPTKSSVVERSVIFSPPHVHLTVHSSTQLSLSHILNLSIYLYSHLFTFSFKISAYKRVYKLKIIFFLFFLYKWHLQGKGVRGTEVSHCITRAYVEAAPNTV